jgi:thioredoxin-like negative regulator of GroEL
MQRGDRIARLAAFLAACVCLAFADVEAVHLYKKGTRHYDENKGNLKNPVKPRWSNIVTAKSVQGFHESLDKEAIALVYFYAPWSPSCVNFYDDVDEIADQLLQLKPPMITVGVDLAATPDLGQQYRINTFPTFAAFRHGVLASAVENQFPRHMSGIVDHMIALAQPAVAEVSSVSDLRNFVNASGVPVAPKTLKPHQHPHRDEAVERAVVVGFLGDESKQEAFVDAARLLGSQFRMVLCREGKVAKAYNATLGQIVVFRDWGDRSPLVFETGAIEPLTPAIARYLIYNAVAPLGVFDDDTKALYAQRHKPLLIYFSPRRLLKSEPLFGELSALHDSNDVNVTVAQTNPNLAGKLITHFLGLDGALSEKPWAIGLLVGRKKYRFDNEQEPTRDNVAAFVRSAVSGEIDEFHRSEPRSILHEAGSGIVSDLAYVDFKRVVVEDEARDALLLYYHPQDTACQEMLEVFDQVAAALQNIAGILVARINIVENDYHDSYAIPGYPTVMYAKRTAKLMPVRMTGVVRTVDHLRDFVASNAVVSLGGLAPSNQTPSANIPQPAEMATHDDL